MRLIGHLPNEASASTFSDYLVVEGISNQVEAEQEGWAVWIHSEDEWEKAREMLRRFLGNPADPRFHKQAAHARALRRAETEAAVESAGRVKTSRELFRSGLPYGPGHLTLVVVGLCLLTQLLRLAGYDESVLREMFISGVDPGGRRLAPGRGLWEVSQGEFWRLLTPILVHGGWLHLILNMLWLLDLGSMVEARKGTGRLGLLIILLGVTSNLGQYYATGPNFCGMSGVIYGLLGYAWIKGKLDPDSGFFLHPMTVALMFIWFLFGVMGWVTGLANVAHGVGLALGVLIGTLGSLPALRRRA